MRQSKEEQQFYRNVERRVRLMSKGLRPVEKMQLRRVARAFMELFYREAERFYLVYHYRLPGSLRTSRLRKKRRTEVLRWANQHINEIRQMEDAER